MLDRQENWRGYVIAKSKLEDDSNRSLTAAAATARRTRPQARARRSARSFGRTTDHAAERLFRDAKIAQIHEGTNEIQRVVVGGALLKGELR